MLLDTLTLRLALLQFYICHDVGRCLHYRYDCICIKTCALQTLFIAVGLWHHSLLLNFITGLLDAVLLRPCLTRASNNALF